MLQSFFLDATRPPLQFPRSELNIYYLIQNNITLFIHGDVKLLIEKHPALLKLNTFV